MAASANRAPKLEADDELIIERVFNAPRALVFTAFTDDKHMLQWMGPTHYPAVDFHQEARVGGRWRGVLRASNGQGADLLQGGEIREIVQNEKIVFTFGWNDAHPAHGPEMVVSVTLSDAGAGKTKMVFRQTKLPSIAERDGHRQGWTSAFGRLDAHLDFAAKTGELKDTIYVFPEESPYIFMTRTFAAPRALVWEAHTKAEHIAKWWGPRGYDIDVKHYDFRAGGAWRIRHSGADGVFEFFGAFSEVTPKDRIVWTFAFEDFPAAVETMTFEDVEGGRTRLTVISRYDSVEARDGMQSSGMEEGAGETYARLEEFLATL